MFGGAFDDPKSLAWRSNQRVVIGWPLDTLIRCRGGVTSEHQHQIIKLKEFNDIEKIQSLLTELHFHTSTLNNTTTWKAEHRQSHV
jgi:hypothetical protein